MRTLGIDFGERRIGLAISDAGGTFALPLLTLERRSDQAAIARIGEIIREEEVESLVVGEPVNVDGTRGPAAERARSFASKLGAATGLPLRLVGETLTTVAAAARLREAGVDARRARERIDSVAAQILLEEALAAPAPEKELLEEERGAV
jgi:putative pre-16S rRNA nuclease